MGTFKQGFGMICENVVIIVAEKSKFYYKNWSQYFINIH